MNKHFQRPRKLYTPRLILMKIHSDLFDIESMVSSAADSIKLTKLEIMVLLLEDRRFFAHWGFDILSIIRETIKICMLKRHGGASTIDMQLVRTVTGYRQRAISRKIYEIILAFIIQFHFSKFTILRSYLNIAFFGSRLYGANAAAYKIFKKRADDLSDEEAAFIAAMLVYPRPLNPTSGWLIKVRRRSEYALSLALRHKERFEKLPIRE